MKLEMTTEQKQAATFYLLLVTLVLIVIVAVGNRNLYSRVRNLEAIRGSQATRQLQQIPSQQGLPKNPE
jgi:hypothetical protein